MKLIQTRVETYVLRKVIKFYRKVVESSNKRKNDMKEKHPGASNMRELAC